MIVNYNDDWLLPHLSSKALQVHPGLFFFALSWGRPLRGGNMVEMIFTPLRKWRVICPQGHRKSPLGLLVYRWGRLASRQADEHCNCFLHLMISLLAFWGIVEQQAGRVRNSSLCVLLMCADQMVYVFLHLVILCCSALYQMSFCLFYR